MSNRDEPELFARIDPFPTNRLSTGRLLSEACSLAHLPVGIRKLGRQLFLFSAPVAGCPVHENDSRPNQAKKLQCRRQRSAEFQTPLTSDPRQTSTTIDA
jgi:hypothetical protein